MFYITSSYGTTVDFTTTHLTSVTPGKISTNVKIYGESNTTGKKTLK